MNDNEKINIQEKIDYRTLQNAINQLMVNYQYDYQLNKTADRTRHDAVLQYGINRRRTANIEVKFRYKDEKDFPTTIVQLNKFQNLGRREREENQKGYVFIFYPKNNSFYVYNVHDMEENFFKNGYSIDNVWIDEYDESKGKHDVANLHLDLSEKYRYEYHFDTNITKEQIQNGQWTTSM